MIIKCQRNFFFIFTINCTITCIIVESSINTGSLCVWCSGTVECWLTSSKPLTKNDDIEGGNVLLLLSDGNESILFSYGNEFSFANVPFYDSSSSSLDFLFLLTYSKSGWFSANFFNTFSICFSSSCSSSLVGVDLDAGWVKKSKI